MAKVNLLSEFDVEQIALVTKGANLKRYFLRKSGEPSADLVESPAEHELIAKADWSRVYCVVAEPGWHEQPGALSGDQSVPDVWASEAEIAKAQRSFVKNGSRINKMHDALIPYGCVIDNAIALADFTVTDPEGEAHLVRKGSWYISIEPTDEGRELIDKGEFTGISVEGTAIRETVEKSARDQLRAAIEKSGDLKGGDRLEDEDLDVILEMNALDVVVKAGSSSALPDLDWSKGQNWIDRLPEAVGKRFKSSWIYRTAKHLVYDKGMPRERAFPVAINAAKRGCATGDLNFAGRQDVNAASRAEMCEGVAAWEAAKAANKAKSVAKAEEETGPMSLIRKMAEHLGMTREQIEEAELEPVEKTDDESSVRPDAETFDSMDEAALKSHVEEQIAEAVPAAIEKALAPLTEKLTELSEKQTPAVPVEKADVDSISERLDAAVESINETIAKIGEDLDALAEGESQQNNGEVPEPVAKSTVQSLAEEIL